MDIPLQIQLDGSYMIMPIRRDKWQHLIRCLVLRNWYKAEFLAQTAYAYPVGGGAANIKAAGNNREELFYFFFFLFPPASSHVCSRVCGALAHTCNICRGSSADDLLYRFFGSSFVLYYAESCRPT